MRTLLVLTLAVLVLGGPSWAQGQGQQRPQRPQLTAEQRQKLQEARDRFAREAIDLRAAVAKERLELRRLLRAENPNMAQVESQLRRLSEAEARLRMARIRFQQEVRQIVGPEQYARFRAMWREDFRERPHPRMRPLIRERIMRFRAPGPGLRMQPEPPDREGF